MPDPRERHLIRYAGGFAPLTVARAEGGPRRAAFAHAEAAACCPTSSTMSRMIFERSKSFGV